jgi:hypothetical protein
MPEISNASIAGGETIIYHPRSKMPPNACLQRNDVRNAIACAAAVALAFLIVNPFVQMPFNDDWTYSFTVRELIRTGHLTYHCGESAAFITQAYWGAFIARLFGFSFVALRFSTLPCAAGSAALGYLLAREASLRPAPAIFSAMLLGFSPVFLPLATSFMTDVPSLFFLLFSIYTFSLAARLESRAALGALAIGFIAGLIGGLNRQTVWIVPLTAGPYIAWLRRSERSFAVTSTIGVLINLGAALGTAKWFYVQPYVMSEWSFNQTLKAGLRNWRYCEALWLSILLTTLLLILPAALPVAWASLIVTLRNARTRRGALAGVAALILSAQIMVWPDLTIEPWLGEIVSRRGVMSVGELSGHRPISQATSLRELLAAVVLVIAWLALTDLLEALVKPHCIKRLAQFFRPEGNNVVLQLLCLFMIAYLGLLAYRAPHGFIYDRYSLPLIPCLAIPLLLRGQSLRAGAAAGKYRNFIVLAWGLLVLWGLYAIASSQDVHALAQARRTAIDRLLGSGVPDTQIACGGEWDNWTQLIHEGHLNILGINSPPGSYNPNLGGTPSLKCLYRVEFSLGRDTVPSSFGSVHYLSWLPPFHRSIYIDRFRNPTWLNSAASSSIPPPTDYEIFDHD